MNKTLLILLLILSNVVWGQNLVPNPSFEDYDTCPEHPTYVGNNQIGRSIGWKHPTLLGTSDYFNRCADESNIWTTVNVPNTFTGYQQPYDGDAFTGLYVYGISNGIYGTEYIQCELSSNLIQGQVYHLSFHVSLANHSEYAIKEIGAYFSNTPISRNDAKNFNFSPQVKSSNTFLADTSSWMLIEGEFKAIGGEQFITIGNFQDSISTEILQTNVNNPIGEKLSYYFIDGVELKEHDSIIEISIPNVFSPNSDGVNDVFSFNLQFVSTVIYNRCGEKVFETTLPNHYWDGRTNAGLKVTEGTYFYVIETNNEKYQGFVQVVR